MDVEGLQTVMKDEKPSRHASYAIGTYDSDKTDLAG